MKKQLFILIALFLLAPNANVASGYNNALHEVNSLAFGLQSSVYSNNGILDGSTELSRIGRALVHKGHKKFWNHPATQNGITYLSWIAPIGKGVTLISNIIRTGTKLITKQAVKGGTQIVYRVFGGESKALGKSWTPVNPGSVSNYRNMAGLPHVNTGQFIIEGTVKNANILLQRGALPLNGNTGGIMEYIIKDPTKIRINGVWGVNPPF